MKKRKIQSLIITAVLFLGVNGLVLAQGENLRVGEIKFTHLSQIPEDLLLSKLPIRTGDKYTNKDLSDIYLAMKRLNYISNVNVYPKIEGDIVNFEIEVDERENALDIARQEAAYEELSKRTEYLVSNVDIEGDITTLDKNELLNSLPVKVGEYFVPQEVIDGAQKIYSTGYFYDVEPKVERKVDNTISVAYLVKENPKINDITIVGNTLFSQEELINASGLKKGEVLNRNLLNPNTSGILNHYNKAGYSLASIGNMNVTFEGDIRIEVTEGIVSSVTFKKVVGKRDNERKNEKRANLRTQPYIFERVQEVKPGEIFQSKNIENTINELYRTGIFTSIRPVFTGSETDPNARNVEFLVEERATTTINGSISYGTEVGLVGGIKLSDANLLGKGQEAALNIEASNSGDKTFEMSFSDPWIKNTERIQAGGAIYWRQTVDDDAGVNEIEKVRRIGTRWEIGKGLNSDIHVRSAIRFDNYKEFYAGNILGDKYNLLAYTPVLIYDTRNNRYNPTKGLFTTLSYEIGKLYSRYNINGEEGKGYNQFQIDLRAYHPTFFGDKNTMAYRAVWGKTGSGTPDALRYSVGGSESIRGYEAGDFDGFDKFHATIENRTQINKALQFVTFFDIGNAWQSSATSTLTGRTIYKTDRSSASKFKDLKKGYGIGLRLETPIGPLRFDYGWPMDPVTKGEKKTGGKFYFSFGQTF